MRAHTQAGAQRTENEGVQMAAAQQRLRSGAGSGSCGGNLDQNEKGAILTAGWERGQILGM